MTQETTIKKTSDIKGLIDQAKENIHRVTAISYAMRCADESAGLSEGDMLYMIQNLGEQISHYMEAAFESVLNVEEELVKG